MMLRNEVLTSDKLIAIKVHLTDGDIVKTRNSLTVTLDAALVKNMTSKVM